MADIPGVSCVFETCRLGSNDCLRQGLVKKGVLHIELVRRPATGETKRKHCLDGGWLDDGAESLVEVDPGALDEATQDPACLVALK